MIPTSVINSPQAVTSRTGNHTQLRIVHLRILAINIQGYCNLTRRIFLHVFTIEAHLVTTDERIIEGTVTIVISVVTIGIIVTIVIIETTADSINNIVGHHSNREITADTDLVPHSITLWTALK